MRLCNHIRWWKNLDFDYVVIQIQDIQNETPIFRFRENLHRIVSKMNTTLRFVYQTGQSVRKLFQIQSVRRRMDWAYRPGLECVKRHSNAQQRRPRCVECLRGRVGGEDGCGKGCTLRTCCVPLH